MGVEVPVVPAIVKNESGMRSVDSWLDPPVKGTKNPSALPIYPLTTRPTMLRPNNPNISIKLLPLPFPFTSHSPPLP